MKTIRAAALRAAAFSRDGKYLATASDDNTAALWCAQYPVVDSRGMDFPISSVK